MNEQVKTINKRLREIDKELQNYEKEIDKAYEELEKSLFLIKYSDIKKLMKPLYTENHYLNDIKDKIRAEYCRKKAKESYYKKKGLTK